MKRRRYTVKLAHEDTPRVILGYDRQSVIDHYARRSLVVESVTAGDYHKQARNAAIKASGGGWALDMDAINQAIDLLGLTWPVKFRLNGRVGPTAANHSMKQSSGNVHHIMVKTYAKMEDVSENIWHELTHAMQAERAGSVDAWCDESRRQRRYPYSIRPIEVEARDMERLMADVTLVRPA